MTWGEGFGEQVLVHPEFRLTVEPTGTCTRSTEGFSHSPAENPAPDAEPAPGRTVGEVPVS